jgi:hypothetical protein
LAKCASAAGVAIYVDFTTVIREVLSSALFSWKYFNLGIQGLIQHIKPFQALGQRILRELLNFPSTSILSYGLRIILNQNGNYIMNVVKSLLTQGTPIKFIEACFIHFLVANELMPPFINWK